MQLNLLVSVLTADSEAARIGLISPKSELFVTFALFVLSDETLAEFGVEVADTELVVSKLIRGRWPGKWLIM